MVEKYVLFFVLVIFQSMSFTFISRARNRNNIGLAGVASLFSNGAWILVFRQIVLNVHDMWIYVIYVIAMAIGTLIQMKLSMKIEGWLKTKSDAWKS